MNHDQIRKALASGPTPGPWSAVSRGAYWDGEEGDVTDSDGNDVEQAEFVKPIGDVYTTRGQMKYVDAAYIAAVNPQAVAALLEDRDRLERNRDMWKAQCERQAEMLTELRAAASLQDPQENRDV